MAGRFPPDERRLPEVASAARRRRAMPAFAAIAVALVAGVAFYSLRNDLPGIAATDAQAVDRGRELYAAACASCHGASLEGQKDWQRRGPNGRMPAPPHDASGHTWHHPDATLFAITKHGPAAYPANYETDMPAFAGRLSDDDIVAILAYIKSTWPPPIREKQSRMNAESKR